MGKPEYFAPEGSIWVCAACGKYGSDRAWIGDESCFMNAVLCKDTGTSTSWEAFDLPKYPSVDEMNDAILKARDAQKTK